MFGKPSTPSGRHVEHRGVRNNSENPMLFEAIDGDPVPLLPYAADGSPRVPDGISLFTLAQAVKHFGKSEQSLRDRWNAVWAGYVPDDVDAVPPVITDAAAKDLASDEPVVRTPAERTK